MSTSASVFPEQHAARRVRDRLAEAPTPDQMLTYRRAGRILELGLVELTESEPLH